MYKNLPLGQKHSFDWGQNYTNYAKTGDFTPFTALADKEWYVGGKGPPARWLPCKNLYLLASCIPPNRRYLKEEYCGVADNISSNKMGLCPPVSPW